ncbi:2-polyprenyl-3-methyl-5-hydroxy-6-metoxy-1,4-benzoquinol methylase [Paenibacillus mucilaginosus]|uniref:class I SAM-dependent methyltransferase n=1 Tax=Paenibacillus mucilaginosus TaxID=61624 RepID=UPI003D21F462
MNSVKLRRIRQAERQYHEQYYKKVHLYQKGSWLSRPIPLVMELAGKLDEQRNPSQPVRVLDLGSGVGRNAIPLAKRFMPSGGSVHCVDLLDSALQKLKEYCRRYGVEEAVTCEQADLGEVAIGNEAYDYILAAGAMEHCGSEEVLKRTVRSMAEGVRPGGILCILMNTDIEEFDKRTGAKRETMIEVVLKSDEALKLLREAAEGWEELHAEVEPLHLGINRGDVPVLMKGHCVAFGARKPLR